MEAYRGMDNFIAGIDLEPEVEEIPLSLFERALEVATIPPLRPEAPAPWHPRLTFDIALGEEPQVLCDRYTISMEQLEDYNYVAAFRREVADHQTHIREEGVTFRQKARVQAEMYLEVLDDIVNNNLVSPATRLSAIQSVVKWGDLEPKIDKAAQQGGNVQAFQININL